MILMKLHSRLAGIMLFLKGIYRLWRNKQFFWLIHFANDRYWYSLKALYSGLRMNCGGQGTIWNFRRNIHRLEKGSLHKEQKAVFAEDYIFETVDYFEQILSISTCDPKTIVWGESVLDHYFKTCRHTKRVADAYARYLKIKPGHNQSSWQSYPAKQRPDLVVEYESLYQLAIRRRSVRFYLDKPVDYEAVEPAMRVAALSPSACNRQSFKFLFYNDRETVHKISQIPGGFTGYEVPSIVVVVASYRGYFDERDVNVPIIDSSLAAMSFLFALETLGLSSVCMNWPAMPDRDEAVRQVIHLTDDEVIVMLIGVGYPEPDGKVAYSAKRDVQSLMKCNEGVFK
jgi:nitroreductase